MGSKIKKILSNSRKSSGHLSAYDNILSGMVDLLERARHASARAVNSIMTATYWEIGRRIVEIEQKGSKKAVYGKELIAQLSIDLTARFGRGFSPVNLSQMRKFFLCWPPDRIFQTASEKLQMTSEGFSLRDVTTQFKLPWSHYVHLLGVKSTEARSFYETEALCGGWSVRQLHRQINSQFYERTALSRNKAAMLTRGALPKSGDADAGQMHLYLNYAREQWTKAGENPPVGLVLCASKGAALAKYATEGLPNKMLVREYLTVLPKPDLLEAEIKKTRRQFERNRILRRKLS